MRRIIIAGSRDFCDRKKFDEIMEKLFSGTTEDEIEVISGGCRGADAMGEEWARSRGLRLSIFSADWEKYGKAAGPIRNAQMAEYAAKSENGMLVAFPVGESRGTYSMVRIAMKHGLETVVIS